MTVRCSGGDPRPQQPLLQSPENPTRALFKRAAPMFSSVDPVLRGETLFPLLKGEAWRPLLVSIEFILQKCS